MTASRATMSAQGSSDDTALTQRAMLCVAFEAHRSLAGGARYALDDVSEVILARGEGTRTASRGARPAGVTLQVLLPDDQVSSVHASVTRSAHGWTFADANSKNGSFVNGVKVTERVLADGDVVEIGRTFLVFRTHAAPAECADLDSVALDAEPAGLRTLVPGLAESFVGLKRMAVSPLSLVIQGETGTGKEVIAKAIHALSGRKGPIVTVNCGAVAEGILESELFGSRKGAFSGAEERVGLIRSAQGGTLFLDEIGEMSPAMQVKLLRVIQEREVIPVGGSEPTSVDVRFVAATHRDLEDSVERGQFREDLFGRLSGYELKLPPLRERREDMGILVASLLAKLAAQQATFDVKAARCLLLYSWPRNVRELEQALARAIGLSGGTPIKIKHLPDRIAAVATGQFTARGTSASDTPAPPSRRRPSRDELAGVLDKLAWNIAAVAAHYGKDPRQIRRWLEHYQLAADDA